MAARGWNFGWRDYPWARPIKQVLADEERLARARASLIEQQAKAVEDADRERASKEFVEARAQELQVLKLARSDVLGALAIAAELTPAMRTLGKLVMERINGGNIDPKEAMTLLTRHSQLVARATQAADAIVKLGRLDRGQTTTNVGVGPMTDFSYEQALEELEGAEELLEVVRAKNVRVVEMPALPEGSP